MKNLTEGLEFLYRLIESLPDGIIVYDLEGNVSLLNKIVLNQFGLEGSVSEYLEQPVRNIVTSEIVSNHIVKTITTGRYGFELKNVKIGDTYLDVQGKKILEGTILIFHDVTESVNNKNATLANLIKGQEMERERLSKEIHDGVGPNLSAIKLGIDAVLTRASNEDIMERLKRLSTHVSEVAKEIREVSHDLMPSSILDFGIKSALDGLITRINNSAEVAFDAEINITDTKPNLSQSQALNIYRTVQEAINNGIRHGKADTFQIKIDHKKDKLLINISDNGRHSSIGNKPGIGITNMRSRIQSMNGVLKTNDLGKEGYEVVAWVPIIK